MTPSMNYRTKALATGFMVLVLFSIPLFWARYFCEIGLRASLPNEAKQVAISPSGLLPESVENDPNTHRQSRVSANMKGDALLNTLGIRDYILSQTPGGRRSSVFRYNEDRAWMYFDRSTGHLVLRHRFLEERKGRDVSRVTVPYYAGPNGVSKSPDADVGRFIDPIVQEGESLPRFVYDRKLRRFFRIYVDVHTVEVQAGPELDAAAAFEPVSIGSSGERESVRVYCQPTMRRVPRENQTNPDRQYNWRCTMLCGMGNAREWLPVVDASGRIDILDYDTLKLTKGNSHLPAPKTLYGQGVARPDQLLDYAVLPVRFGHNSEQLGVDWQHTGLLAASLSRQGTSMTLAVFDEDGELIRSAVSQAIPYHLKAWTIENALHERAQEGKPGPAQLQDRRVGAAWAAMYEVPGGPLLTALKYGVENLHPPLLTAASYFLAHRIEASASHRTLFLIPNSFAALQQDVMGYSILTRFGGALVMMLPAILLAVLLTWRVVRDAKTVGLSSNARLLWMLGTLGFGLPAYITYRLTRPKAVLVTCANCGLPRRPDMERCHRCNGPWRTPELDPPTWSVLEGDSRQIDGPCATVGDSPAE